MSNRYLLLGASVALAGVLLTGCSAATSGSPSENAAATASPTPTPTASADPAVDGPGTLLIEMNGDASCELQQPVLIDLPSTVVSLTGDCGVITVTADFVKLTVDSATSLQLESDASTVTARKLDEVTVSGAQNQVTWTEGASSGTDTGLSNTLTH